MLRPPTSQTAASLFGHYELDASFDEMFKPGHVPRDAYRLLFDRLLELPASEWRQRQQAADRAFLNQGVTFTVYGNDEGTERIFPYDILPRIITGAEWSVVERGLAQRLLALNLFLKDIYHEGKILAEGIVPRELVYSCPHYRREMCGVRVRRDTYVSVAGTDLVRVEDGGFAVLEDNLRVPSGVSYMLANRQVMKRVFPGLFSRYRVRPIDHYGQQLLGTLRALAPRPNDPTIVVLTPGRPQLRLLRAHLPGPADGRRAGRGPRPLRARQRRLHADHRRPAAGRRDLSPRRRRLPRSAGLPARLAARRGRTVQRLPGRQRVAGQRRRHRRRRRQGGLRLRAADDQVLPAAGRHPAQHRDLPAARRRPSASTSWRTSSGWW